MALSLASILVICTQFVRRNFDLPQASYSAPSNAGKVKTYRCPSEQTRSPPDLRPLSGDPGRLQRDAPAGAVIYCLACSSTHLVISSTSADCSSMVFWAIFLAASSLPCCSSTLAMAMAPR